MNRNISVKVPEIPVLRPLIVLGSTELLTQSDLSPHCSEFSTSLLVDTSVGKPSRVTILTSIPVPKCFPVVPESEEGS